MDRKLDRYKGLLFSWNAAGIVLNEHLISLFEAQQRNYIEFKNSFPKPFGVVTNIIQLGERKSIL